MKPYVVVTVSLDHNIVVCIDAGAQYESEALRIGNCQLTHLSQGNKN